ncbi:MAG: hypothetical protein ACTSPD_01385 [Promethearchaeota archaeon]
MKISELNENINKILYIFNELDFNLLIYNDEILNNPYSLIHPGKLFYFWGKILAFNRDNIENVNEKFNFAIELYDKAIKETLNKHEYSEAGEFLLLKLKVDGHRKPKSSNLKNIYKKAQKIFKNLLVLYNEAFFIDCLIEVNELYEKYALLKKNRKKIENLYRLAAYQYFLEAENMKENELKMLKIINYLKSITYLDKIKDSISDFNIINKNSIVNKLIYELKSQIDLLNKNGNLNDYSKKKVKLNLYFGLGKVYKLVDDINTSNFFLNKALKFSEKITNDSTMIPLLLKSSMILYKEQSYYRVQNIEFLNKNFFKKYLIISEKIELLNLKIQILSDLNQLNPNKVKNPENYIKNLIENYKELIILFKDEINNSILKEEISESIKTKYIAYCIYLYYQIIKLILRKKEKR